MWLRKCILITCLSFSLFSEGTAQKTSTVLRFDFLGDTLVLPYDQAPYYRYTAALSEQSVNEFYETLNTTDYKTLVNALLAYRDKLNLDDWLYYQLVRKTAQQLSPKADNYHSYTLYKWFLLSRSGYDAILRYAGNKLLFYVQCDEMIYNIPFCILDNKQYICLNYHDYGYNIDFDKEHFSTLNLPEENLKKAFTYKVTRLPEFNTNEYVEKDLQFNYSQQEYHFRIKLNPEVKKLFTNYPVADFSNHFNIPLSKQTYNSLVPALKDIVSRMSTKNGIDYLMHFTRYAFLYEKDSDAFGREKRFSPEETLLYDYSDCEDRASLFFFLVKEIYNLPMIVLNYPEHVTIAVRFEKPVGETIVYNGKKYSVCEPTPQRKDLPVGKQPPSLRKQAYEVVYEYLPTKTLASNFDKAKN